MIFFFKPYILMSRRGVKADIVIAGQVFQI